MVVLDAASAQEQDRIGERLAAAVGAARGNPGVIFLHGDLGAGKTTLVRGFLRALGYAGAVKSPTYTLLEPYLIGELPVYHLDLYRLAAPGELEYLGIRDLLEQRAVLLVEWPEQGVGELPEPDLTVDIEYRDEGRRLCIAAATPRGEEILTLLTQSA